MTHVPEKVGVVERCHGEYQTYHEVRVVIWDDVHGGSGVQVLVIRDPRKAGQRVDDTGEMYELWTGGRSSTCLTGAYESNSISICLQVVNHRSGAEVAQLAATHLTSMDGTSAHVHGSSWYERSRSSPQLPNQALRGEWRKNVPKLQGTLVSCACPHLEFATEPLR